MPGVERFKIASAQNLPVAFHARAILKGDITRQYSPKSRSFIEPFTPVKAPSDDWELDGPFSYFLSTTIANRLEPAFVIAPTLSTIPPTSSTSANVSTQREASSSKAQSSRPTMDIIVIRPERSPLIRAAEAKGEEASSAARAKLVGEIAGKIYDNGKHVDLIYPADPNGPLEMGGDGDVVVEVFRAEGFEWIPTVGVLLVSWSSV